MSDSALIINILSLLPPLAAVYAAYWAFDISHVLPARLYRNQAFGLGVFSLVLLIAVLPSPSPGSSGIVGSSWFEVAYTLVTAIFWLGTLYFVDASALAGRRSDPLLRDSLHWSKVRYALWFVQIFNVSFIMLGVIISAVTGNSLLSNQIILGNNGAYMTSFPAFIANFAWVLSFAPFVVFVPLAFRVKDPTFRRHFKWLALLAGLTGLWIIVTGILSSIPLFVSFQSSSLGNFLGNALFLVIAGYCCYRSARALVPLNRISTLETIPSVGRSMPQI